MNRTDKLVDILIKELHGHDLIIVAALAGRERKLRAAAKAVLKAANGASESDFEEAIDQLKKALK